MGLWKRVSERTKQSFGVKANQSDWKPTSNARNLAMIEEARKFSKHLKLMHRELRDMEGRIEGNLVILKTVLSAPLPRVYDVSDKGPVPVDKEAVIVGAGVSFDTLSAAGIELKAKLQAEVLHPLDQWQAAYRMIKHRNVKCEELRLELDAKRREAAAMTVTLDKQKTRAQSHDTDKAAAEAVRSSGGAPTPGGNNKFEDAEFRLQKEEDKVSRLQERYKGVESEVFDALLTLINDTKVLKQYGATALVVYQHAFAHAYTAFDGAHAPTGAQPASSSTPPPKPPRDVNKAGEEQTPDSKASPGTPDPSQLPISTPPLPPAWYTEARANAGTMKYDSDDEQ